jgi:hypothetical protein
MANEEYPLVLHRGTYEKHECLTVADAAAEKAAAKDGWSRTQPRAPWFPEPVADEDAAAILAQDDATPARKKPGPKLKAH